MQPHRRRLLGGAIVCFLAFAGRPTGASQRICPDSSLDRACGFQSHLYEGVFCRSGRPWHVFGPSPSRPKLESWEISTIQSFRELYLRHLRVAAPKNAFNSRLTLAADHSLRLDRARRLKVTAVRHLSLVVGLAAAARREELQSRTSAPPDELKRSPKRSVFPTRSRGARRRRRPDAAQAPQESGSHPAGQSR